MKLELQSAANFLVHLIRLGRRNISETHLEEFRDAIVDTLRRRYRDHWFPERPFRGSGYRCIRINGHMDPVIAQAAERCGLSSTTIHSTFPKELTMWVDPLEVSYRIGENGSICVLYEYKENASGNPTAWQPSMTSSSSSDTKSRSATPTDNAVVNNKKDLSSSSEPSSPSHLSTSRTSASNINQVQQQQRQQQIAFNKSVSNKHHNLMNNLNHPQHQLLNATTTAVFPNTKHLSTTSPADSLYKIDCLLDPRKSVSIEQLTAYVSS